MQVSVRFFTVLREITGKREESLSFKDSETVTIKTVLDTLSRRYGKSFVEYVFERETRETKGFLQLLVNGKNASTPDFLCTRLSDGDVLAIIPPVGGG